MKVILSCLSLLGVSALGPDGKCRILAMKGGGVHGSYEVGVLKGIIESMDDPIEYRYDIVSGVSAGSLNAAVLGLYPPGEEKAALEELMHMYTSTTPKDYFKFWSTYVLEPFWKNSLVDV